MDSITQKDVIRIMELVEKTGTDELHLEMGDLKLTIRKGLAAESMPSMPAVETTSMPVARDVSTPSNGLEKADEGAAPDTFEDQTDGILTIKAPMLGTFYEAPKPGASPFVEVGQVVNIDDTVCIIEVMKLFSTITAGVQGRIVKVLVEDSQMVEFNQPLFLVEAVTVKEAPAKRKIS
jgi:acetyl-CoA carboxylase biotin carboxyl carrier protein